MAIDRALRLRAQNLKSGSRLVDLFVSSGCKRQNRLLDVLALDQDVIGIKCGNCEDRDLRLRQRLYKRCQNARHQERKRPFQLQRQPAALSGSALGQRIRGAEIIRTDNGKLIVRAHHAEKSALKRPVRDVGLGSKPANRQLLDQHAVLQGVGQFSKEVTTLLGEPAIATITAHHGPEPCSVGGGLPDSVPARARSFTPTAYLRPSARSGTFVRRRTKRSCRPFRLLLQCRSLRCSSCA